MDAKSITLRGRIKHDLTINSLSRTRPFAEGLSTQNPPNTAPATKNNTPILLNILPATKNNIAKLSFALPATTNNTPTSPNIRLERIIALLS